jgi:glycosyltransferase involved in cell wall biosynthesis
MEKPKDYPKISVIICSLNEEGSLPDVLRKIPEWVDEVILMDGHSVDATVEVAKKFCPRIRVLFQEGKGKGDALRMGIREAEGAIIVTLDADGATNPQEMLNFIAPLLNGYDFAKGSRFSNGFTRKRPLYRVVGNWIITLTFNILFLTRYTDICSGYNAFWKSVAEKINPWPSDGFENEPFINCRVRKLRFKVMEVAHEDYAREKGKVKELSWRQGPKAIKTIIRERAHVR